MGVPVNIVPREVVAQIIAEEAAALDIDDERVERVALAVLSAESGLNQYAINLVLYDDDPDDPAHASLDRGIGQWNDHYWPEVTNRQAFDVRASVRLMLEHVAAADTPAEGFLLWNAFDTLAFIDHLEAT